MEFNDFFGEIWSMDINSHGTNFIAVSSDLSIRLYQITQEQVIVDMEKERRVDKVLEEELQKDIEANSTNIIVFKKMFNSL